MNAFDYFFEHTATLETPFLVGKEEISYKDLFNSCIRLACWLEKKVGRNKHLIIMSVNNLFFLKTYLSIIKSGNICIPLDPYIEKKNFYYIYKLTDPDLIFLTQDVKERLDLKAINYILPDTLPHENVSSTRLDKDDYGEENCAEIIFTSGSTGKPKGVMISHGNLIANTSSITEYLKLNDDDRMLVVLPFYYCFGLSLLHTHLRVGGSIVLNNSFIFLGTVIKDLLEYKCTGFAGVPSHFQILLRKSDSFKKTNFPDLKYVTQAGGKLATVFTDEFRQSHPDIRFIVMYGQTEATARLSWLPPESYERKKGSIGRGIPGVKLKVVNKKGKEVQQGESGEVIAKGENVMMGYFKDKKGTKKAIRNGWLHTGDIGTIDEEGYIYLTARSKEIIKVRGKRVNPKEIEAVILKIPEVIDCSVEGIEDEIEGESLKATIILNKQAGNFINDESIKKYCSNHLESYKIPYIYVFQEQLTISPTGKKIKNT
jgi:acyl-CoA synthetase (AMP-forming)/AMP-acid ligase II